MVREKIDSIINARDSRDFDSMWNQVHEFVASEEGTKSDARVVYDNSMWTDEDLYYGAVGESYLDYTDERGERHHVVLWEAYN